MKSLNNSRHLGVCSAAAVPMTGAMGVSANSRGAWRHSASASALLVGLLVLPTGAFAADVAIDDESTLIGEVVVTAQKRSENLQDVPVAITAFTGEMRDKSGLVSAQQQLNFTPGVNYSPGADRITIRGVGRVTTQIGTDQGVAVYQDGFYVGSAGGLGASSLGIDRNEILRGPQGTLYGRNSIGGAVNIISRRPDKEFTGEVRATYNNYSGTSVDARVSGPVTENIRLSAQITAFQQEQGYYHNTLPPPTAGSVPGGPNGAGPLLNTATVLPVMLDPQVKDEGEGTGHGRTINLQAEFDFGEQFEGWVRYVNIDNHTRPRDQVGISEWSLLPLIVPNVFTGFQPDQNPGIKDHRAFFANRNTDNHLHDYQQLIGNMTWHAESFDVKYIGGYSEFTNNNFIDGDSTGSPNFRTPGLFGGTVIARNDVAYRTDDTNKSFSHEINITSTNDSPFQWLVGGYFFHEKRSQNFDVPVFGETALVQTTDYLFGPTNFFTAGLQAAIGPVPSRPISNPESLLYEYQADLNTTSKAIFGQIDYQLNDQIKLIAGLRYSHDKKRGYEVQESITQIVLADQPTAAGLNAALLGAGLPGWPVYPAGHPLAGQFVQDYVFGGCAGAGTAAGDAQGIFPLNVVTATQGPCPGGRSLKDSWSAVTGTAAIEYSPNDDTNLYLRYSRGYKSGGFNLGTLAAGAVVDSEEIDAFEAGWKQDFGRALQVNVAAYLYNYKGLQSLNARVAQLNPPIVVNQLVNLDKSRSWGVEVESRWAPVDNLLIMANYAYINNEIRKACCFADSSDPTGAQPGAKPVPGQGGAQDLKGNRLPGSSKHKITVAASYTFEFEPGDLTVSVIEDYHSSFYSSLFNNPNWFVKGGARTDARISWASAEKNYEIIGSVTNLFDKEIRTSVATLPPNQNFYQLLYLQPPRVWSVELRYKF
ncbi:MAG: TonB-dependent receptor [Pseudomonadota bacterium]